MRKIQVLDQITIDKIAAGEVIERPASIVKELIENAIDAGATAIVAEIKEGGIAFIRITDNGCGIDQDDVRSAFLRHSTSKIRSVEDLSGIATLGFRGEALSSIAAVAQVELITRTKDNDHGVSYRIEGGREISMEPMGAPCGTTFLVRQLFYNTPARRKFLKTPMTEASHVADLVLRLALSHPEISFQFINNGQSKIHTSGNGNLKDVIYHLYGRDIASHLLEVNREVPGLKIRGFIGEPIISRGNRNFENYFINGRYIKNNIISKAIEDAYKDYSMQHRYPLTVLLLEMDGDLLDVNVHPAKMEVRFGRQQEVYQFVLDSIAGRLRGDELIPEIELPFPKPQEITVPNLPGQQKSFVALREDLPPLEQRPSGMPHNTSVIREKGNYSAVPGGKRDLNYFMEQMRKRVSEYHHKETGKPKETVLSKEPEQISLFDDKLLSEESLNKHRIIGQVFETYWLIEYKDNLYIIDQHAAHERVLYEKTLHQMKTREYTSQNISPPLILELTMKEAMLLNTYKDRFTCLGFEIEPFGEDTFAISAVPDNLFSIVKKDLFIQMLDDIADEIVPNITPELIDEKIASMSCKAAVKGNMKMSYKEVDVLITELLSLDNPYHCPHGRPVIISLSKRELEKKFKRIV